MSCAKREIIEQLKFNFIQGLNMTPNLTLTEVKSAIAVLEKVRSSLETSDVSDKADKGRTCHPDSLQVHAKHINVKVTDVRACLQEMGFLKAVECYDGRMQLEPTKHALDAGLLYCDESGMGYQIPRITEKGRIVFTKAFFESVAPALGTKA